MYNRGAFTNFKKGDFSPGANISKGIFDNTIKKVNTAQDQPKARFVAQSQRKNAKPYVVLNLATFRRRSTRIIASTSSSLDPRLFSHDVTQALLQSIDPFTSRIYLDPQPAERELLGIADG